MDQAECNASQDHAGKMSIVSHVTCIFTIQQEQLLGELHWHIHQDPPPDDALMTSETLAYLEACHLLFERGLLSHERIRSMDSEVLKNISKRYEYFSGWLTSILDKGILHNHLYFGLWIMQIFVIFI